MNEKDLKRLNEERKRNHIRSAVESDGYGGMVNTARNTFLENYQVFLRKKIKTNAR